MQKKTIGWIILFLAAIYVPALSYQVVSRYMDTSNYENRESAVRPKLTIENYSDFPEEFEEYYDDHLPFRNQWITLNNSIDYYIFSQSSSDDVLIGKDGWLFYTSEKDGNPVKQSTGEWMFTEKQLKKIAKNLKKTKKTLENQGIRFVLFIAPNKETIYKDELPSFYQNENTKSCVDQLVEYLKENTDIEVVYPKEELLEARKEHEDIEWYHKLDTHWNSAGAYIGAENLAKALNIEMPVFEELTLEKQTWDTGDLAQMLNITIKNGDTNYTLSNISDRETECEKWDFYTEFIYHTADADPRKLFVCRDSFSDALAPILATQFENSMFVHRKGFSQEQIFAYDTDIFVYECVERYIKKLEKFCIE